MNDRQLETLIKMAMEAESLETGLHHDASPVVARIGPGSRRVAGLIASLAAAAGLAIVIWPSAPAKHAPIPTSTGTLAMGGSASHDDGRDGSAHTLAMPKSESAKTNSSEMTLASGPAASDSLASQVLVVLRTGANGCGCAKVENTEWASDAKDATRLIYARADTDQTSPTLNVNDFACFHKSFVSGDAAANCDGSTTGPMLSVNDLVCFTNKFAHGCM